jgi:hypothetical protein
MHILRSAPDCYAKLTSNLRTLSSLGALVVVFSLAFDTFAQQVLTTEAHSVKSTISNLPTSSAVTLPRNTEYKNQTVIGELGKFDLEFIISYSRLIGGINAPLGVKGALLSSVLNPIALPAATYPTGNCRWPTTPTLGICNSCEDVKQQMITNVFPDVNEILYTLLWPEPVSLITGNCSDNNNCPNTTFTFNILPHIDFALAQQTTANFYPNLTKDGRLLVSQFHLIGIPPSTFNQFVMTYGSGQPLQPDDINSLMRDYYCSFYFCLQAFAANSTVGSTQQQLVSTWDQWNPQQTNESSTWTMADPPQIMNLANDSAAPEYQIDETSRQVVTDVFAELVTGGVGSGGPSEDNAHDFGQGFNEQLSAQNEQAIMHAFWNASNDTESQSALPKQVADGFTTYMRTQIPAEPDVRYAPTTFTDEVFVKIRWGWLQFPLGLLVSGHVFLFLTIFNTRKQKVRPWKGHRIPLLLANVDDNIRDITVGGFDSRTGLEDRFGGMKGCMYYDDKDEIAFRKVEAGEEI